MNKLNRFWIVEVSPYNKNWTKGSKNVYKMVKFTITANLSYSSTLHGTWHPEEQNVVHTVRAACPLVTRSAQYSGECQSFSLAFEKTIDHKYHRLDFRIAFDKAAAPEFELGDIEFVLHWGSRSFSKFEIGFTAAYVLLSLAALAFFVAATRRRTAPYSFEQIALLVLLVCAVLYDNPLFMVEYASFSVVLYKVVDSVFKSVFISAVLLFWLFTVESLASERDSSSSVVFLQKAHIPKYAAVLAYFVLSIITFSWAGAVEASDPLLFASATSSSAGLMAFYVLTALVLIGTVLWVAVSAIRSIHVISSDELMFKRFCFFVIPSIFVAGCMIVCSFTGSFGAVVRTRKYWQEKV